MAQNAPAFGRCDMDGNQRLSLAELLPAVNMWADLADQLRCGNQTDEKQDTAAILDAIAASAEMDSAAVDGTLSTGPGRPSAVEAEDPLEARLRERIHRLDGAVVLKTGKMKSFVRTVTMSRIVVDNAMLRQAQLMRKESSKKQMKEKRQKAPQLPPEALEVDAGKSSRMCVIL